MAVFPPLLLSYRTFVQDARKLKPGFGYILQTVAFSVKNITSPWLFPLKKERYNKEKRGCASTFSYHQIVLLQKDLAAVSLAAAVFVFFLTSCLSEKNQASFVAKEKIKTSDEGQKPDVPLYYALLPLMPLIFMLVFSPFFIRTVSIDINTACLVSMAISMIFSVVGRREQKPGAILQMFFSAFGDNMKNLGMVIILAMCFASSLNEVGGMDIISGWISRLTLPPLVLLLIICIFSAGITVVVGSFFGALSIAMPLAASMGTATGLPSDVLCFLVLMSVGAGCQCSPVCPAIIVVADKCNIRTSNLIKRVAPSVLAALIAGAVFAGIYFT